MNKRPPVNRKAVVCVISVLLIAGCCLTIRPLLQRETAQNLPRESAASETVSDNTALSETDFSADSGTVETDSDDSADVDSVDDNKTVVESAPSEPAVDKNVSEETTPAKTEEQTTKAQPETAKENAHSDSTKSDKKQTTVTKSEKTVKTDDSAAEAVSEQKEVKPTEKSEAASVSDVQLLPPDWASLAKTNEDIFAWLEIPDTTVSFPIVKHSTDDSYYLNHSIEKQYDIYGSIFIESYNDTDFSDAMTVIYGHTAANGRMFGTLQQIYSSSRSFHEHTLIRVYQPDGVKEYRIFAAVPYSPIHLLYYYDMSKETVFEAVIDDIYSVRALDAVQDRTEKPQYGEKLLVLSTCMQGDNTHRFLVFAKEITAEMP